MELGAFGLPRPLGRLVLPEPLLDHGKEWFVIGVAHEDQRRVFRPVPRAVVVDELLPRCCLDNLVLPDGKALGEARPFVEFGPQFVADALKRALAAARLFQNDATLLVDLLLDEQHAVDVIAQHGQRFVDLVELGVGGEDHIRSLIEAREGVDVATELHADALKVGNQLARCEVLRSVEAHVLDEMRETTLSVRLVERSRPDVDDDRHLTRRIVVLPVHPRRAVLELSRDDP